MYRQTATDSGNSNLLAPGRLGRPEDAERCDAHMLSGGNVVGVTGMVFEEDNIKKIEGLAYRLLLNKYQHSVCKNIEMTGCYVRF